MILYSSRISFNLNSYIILIGVILTIAIGILIPIIGVNAIMIPIACTVIFVLFIKPRIFFYSVFLFILIAPKINILNVPGTYIGIRGEDLLVLVSFVFIIAYILLKNKSIVLNRVEKKLSIIIFSYLIICFIASLYGFLMGYISNPLLAIMFLFRKFEYMFFIILGYNTIRSFKENSLVIKTLDIVVSLLILIGILQSQGIIGAYMLGQYVPNTETRIVSTFSGPWEYSAFLVLIAPIYIHRLLSRKTKIPVKFYSVVILLLSYYSIFLSQSRISILAFSLLLIFMVLKSKSKIMVGVFVTIILASFAFVKGDDLLPERFETLSISSTIQLTEIAFANADYKDYLNATRLDFTEGLGDLSFSIRVNKWADLLDGFIHNPLLGLGLSTTTEAVDGNYIRYIAESGFLGLALWFLLIFNVVKISKTIKEKNRVLQDGNMDLVASIIQYGTIGLLIIAVFIDIFEASKIAMFYWFIVGLLLKNYSIFMKDESSEELGKLQ